jgi:hypothetical protein
VIEDMRRALMEGLRSVPSVGTVITGRSAQLPFLVVDGDGGEVEPVSACLRDLMVGDASPLTCRSYAFDLLRGTGCCGVLGSAGRRQLRLMSRRWWAGCGPPAILKGSAGGPVRLLRDR